MHGQKPYIDENNTTEPKADSTPAIDHMACQYQVVLMFSEPGKEALTLAYPVNISFGGGRQDEVSVLLNRGQVLCDGALPSLQAEKCNDYAGKCIYPLNITINKDNGRIASIDNMKELQNRWVIAKEQLKLNYEGAFVDQLVQQMEEILNNRKGVLTAIQNNLFYQVYFFPLYTGYPEATIVAISNYCSIVSNSPPIKFSSERSLTLLPDRQGMNITVEGKCSDSRTFSDIMYAKVTPGNEPPGPDSCSGKLALTYDLYANGIVKSINGFLELAGTDREEHIKIEVVIKHIGSKTLTSKDFEPLIVPADSKRNR